MGILRGKNEKKRGEWIDLKKTIENWKTEKKKKKKAKLDIHLTFNLLQFEYEFR